MDTDEDPQTDTNTLDALKKKKGSFRKERYHASRVPLFCCVWAVLTLLCGLMIALYHFQHPFLVYALGFYSLLSGFCEAGGVRLTDDRIFFPLRPFRFAPFFVLGRTHVTLSAITCLVSLPPLFGVVRLYMRTLPYGYQGLFFPSHKAKNEVQNFILSNTTSCKLLPGNTPF